MSFNGSVAVVHSLATTRREVGTDTLSELRADYAGRIDWHPKDNPRGANARRVRWLLAAVRRGGCRQLGWTPLAAAGVAVATVAIDPALGKRR